eukprot:Em0001g1498a
MKMGNGSAPQTSQAVKSVQCRDEGVITFLLLYKELWSHGVRREDIHYPVSTSRKVQMGNESGKIILC